VGWHFRSVKLATVHSKRSSRPSMGTDGLAARKRQTCRCSRMKLVLSLSGLSSPASVRLASPLSPSGSAGPPLSNPCRPSFQGFRRYGIALGNVLVDGLARELVISGDRLPLHWFPRYARYREWASLPDRLNVVWPSFDLLGYFGFKVDIMSATSFR
jgi:hypothetical protein